VPADGDEARGLVAAFLAELGKLYGTGLAPHPAPSEDFVPPRGAWMVLADGAVPVAGGGVRALEADTAEVRRVYAVPESRGRGAGRALLAALEAFARDAGYRRIRLDTGDRQPEALGLFRSSGFRAIPDYNGNAAASCWFEKPL
jgi:GNAT superfamily N-acetyltransferase